jgi:hypothetical protein
MQRKSGCATGCGGGRAPARRKGGGAAGVAAVGGAR